MRIEIYLDLIANAFENTSFANIEAIDAFENVHPEVVDQSYVAGGPLDYDILSGIVHKRQN